MKKEKKEKSTNQNKVLSARVDAYLLMEFDKQAKDKGISRSELLSQRIKAAFSESTVSNEAISDESDALVDKKLEKLTSDPYNALKSETSPSFVVSLPTKQGQSGDFTSPTPIADLSKVISLRIINKTDEKLYNVNIFNYDFKEQNQIKYENLTGMAYSEFLRKWDKLESNKYNINKVRLVAICDYKKFERKQLSGKIFYKNTNVFSLSSAVPTEPMMWHSPYQAQPNIIDIERTFSILSDTEFELEYLMPDTTVDIHFFITKNPETQHGK